jgi:energy-coupling factor transporter ATP-binding protein EcfA2
MANVSVSASPASSFVASTSLTVDRPRIKRISISGYRAFPPYRPTSFEVDLGDDGKNLLLYGENGSGKTSLFRALRELFSDSDGTLDYNERRNVFRQEDDDSVVVELTSGTTTEFRWETGEEHPKETGGAPYRNFARSCLFLDYRDLLQTNFVHSKGSPDLFGLLVKTILQDLPAPSRTLSDLYHSMLDSNPHRRTPRQVQNAEESAQRLTEALENHLPEVVNEGNRLLRKLQRGVEFSLHPETIEYIPVDREFDGQTILLKVSFDGHQVDEPQYFLNEARLTALALSIYLAGARIIRSGRPGILVMDDVLLGLDLSNRIPLLNLLKEEFSEWQILILTHDCTWFDMAVERLDENQWSFQRLHSSREPGTGRERPLQVIETEFLIRAEAFLQAGDYPAAGVYLRSKFESLLRTFAEEKHIQIPFKRELREINSEHLWPKIKVWTPRQDAAPLVSPILSNEVEFCRRFILNPLCHEAHGRPNRSEVELAISVLKQLETAINSTSAWRSEWNQRHPKGQALPKHWHLALCEWLLARNPQPPMSEIAAAVRDAFAVGLENYNQRHHAALAYTADVYLTRQIQWGAAKMAGLSAGHSTFVSLIESNSTWLLAEGVDFPILDSISVVDAKAVFDSLKDGTTGTSIKCVLHQW